MATKTPRKVYKIITCVLSPSDQALFQWYCRHTGITVSERLKELIQEDLRVGKDLLGRVDDTGSEYLVNLKQMIGIE